jgi:hypothetical protein
MLNLVRLSFLWIPFKVKLHLSTFRVISGHFRSFQVEYQSFSTLRDEHSQAKITKSSHYAFTLSRSRTLQVVVLKSCSKTPKSVLDEVVMRDPSGDLWRDWSDEVRSIGKAHAALGDGEWGTRAERNLCGIFGQRMEPCLEVGLPRISARWSDFSLSSTTPT